MSTFCATLRSPWEDFLSYLLILSYLILTQNICITFHKNVKKLSCYFSWVCLPYILKAYMAFSSLGAISLRTENISTKSLKLRFPNPSSEKDSTILFRNGFSCTRKEEKKIHLNVVCVCNPRVILYMTGLKMKLLRHFRGDWLCEVHTKSLYTRWKNHDSAILAPACLRALVGSTDKLLELINTRVLLTTVFDWGMLTLFYCLVFFVWLVILSNSIPHLHRYLLAYIISQKNSWFLTANDVNDLIIWLNVTWLRGEGMRRGWFIKAVIHHRSL